MSLVELLKVLSPYLCLTLQQQGPVEQPQTFLQLILSSRAPFTTIHDSLPVGFDLKADDAGTTILFGFVVVLDDKGDMVEQKCRVTAS